MNSKLVIAFLAASQCSDAIRVSKPVEDVPAAVQSTLEPAEPPWSSFSQARDQDDEPTLCGWASFWGNMFKGIKNFIKKPFQKLQKQWQENQQKKRSKNIQEYVTNKVVPLITSSEGRPVSKLEFETSITKKVYLVVGQSHREFIDREIVFGIVHCLKSLKKSYSDKNTDISKFLPPAKSWIKFVLDKYCSKKVPGCDEISQISNEF